MPLVPPNNLREKILLLGGGGTGKTSAHLSIAFWSFQSGAKEQFYIFDTDDESVLQVMDEAKYAGMLAEDGGNVHIFRVTEWAEYREASEKIMALAGPGDWVVMDFINHFWQEVQEDYLRNEAKKTRAQMIRDAERSGLSGWDLYREINWQYCNAEYMDVVKKLLVQSRANIFMVGEEEEIQVRQKMTADQKEYISQFGHWKVAGGQKKLPYQCRTFLRLQRLARGRVLHTLKDRARTELAGDDLGSDFFSGYLRSVAGWSVEG